MLELIFAAMALGIVLLVVPYFCLQLQQSKHLMPLSIVLLSLAFIATGPVVFTLWPSLVFAYIALMPLAFFTLNPALWFYIKALTAEQPWRFKGADGWHVLPLGFAGVLAVLIQSLSYEQRQLLFFSEASDVAGYTLLVAIVFLAAVLLWLGQSCFYLWLILSRVRSYRRKLRQVFAEDSGKRLAWLEMLVLLLLFSWSYAVLNLMLAERLNSVLLSDALVLFCLLLVAWLVAWCGLTQQPGFSETYKLQAACTEAEELKPDQTETTDAAQGLTKYQRSALGEQQSARIAAKLQQTMQSELLYLDETLTLYKLAEHLAVPAHYLSQTLNQSLQMSFFEYVNQARVEAAKQKLKQSDDSVLSIAMAVGFNARSSFYTAFKTNTGQSPAQFRAAHRQDKQLL
ncbi:AraC family transcriptional regulator [Rheinheimera sediminis]|uniref:helix-turn-helix domain-containing protein n=1 Tax=Rheinheimera sp. YQF-1 TaxID=2499626 RepID=UPI000FD91D47|nr:AraC family transcriptional regulator [Rheinheimera sp. YQF-1]RVT41654.1 AraC family transcriptional regulator [Rheinheimera sp. YQF-1]